MQRSDTLVNVLKFDTCVKLLRVFGTQKNSVVVAADDRNCAKVWCDGKQSKLTLGSCCVNCFYTEQKSLLTVTQDASLKIWDISSGKEVQIFVEEQQDTKVLACDFTKSCCALVTVSNMQCYLRVQYLSASQLSFPLHLQPICCKFSAHGSYIALGFLKGLIQVWNVEGRSVWKQFCVTYDNTILDKKNMFIGFENLYIKDSTLDVNDIQISDTGILAVTTKQCTAVFPPEGPGAYVQFSATHIVKAEDKDSWITIDSHGNVHILEFLNKFPPEGPSGMKLLLDPLDKDNILGGRNLATVMSSGLLAFPFPMTYVKKEEAPLFNMIL